MAPLLAVVDDIVGTFGPFLIPVVLFVLGIVAYGVLFYVGKAGLEDVSGAEDRRDAEEE